NVALQTMKSQRVRRLPVVDAGGRLKGILSLNDVIIHAGAASPTDIVSTMARIGEHRRPRARAGAWGTFAFVSWAAGPKARSSPCRGRTVFRSTLRSLADHRARSCFSEA